MLPQEISLSDYEREVDLEFWLREVSLYHSWLPADVGLIAIKRALKAERAYGSPPDGTSGAYEKIHE